MSLDLEAGLLSLQLYRVSKFSVVCNRNGVLMLVVGTQCPNSYIAFEEAAKIVRELADGTVCSLLPLSSFFNIF